MLSGVLVSTAGTRVCAQFSTQGFDTVIVEKKYRDEFIYWFHSPYSRQVRMVWQDIAQRPKPVGDPWQHCSWKILTEKGNDPWTIWFTLKMQKSYYRNQGVGYIIPWHHTIQDPADPTLAPIALAEPPEPEHFVPSRLFLEGESVVRMVSSNHDSLFAVLYTQPQNRAPFKKWLKQYVRSDEGDAPVLNQAFIDPIYRDAGLLIYLDQVRYALLCSGAQRRIWLFRDDQLLAMFQYDLDHLPSIQGPQMPFRIEPYMFVRPGLDTADQQKLPLFLMLGRASAELVKDRRFF